MKKIILFLSIFFIFISCQKTKVDSDFIITKKIEKQNFKGFCDLMIGYDFKSIPSFNKFKKTDEETYYAESYELSKSIGTVLFVTVILKDGKIDKIGFMSGSISNKNKIDSCFNSYKSTDLKLPSSTESNKSYVSKSHVVISYIWL